MQAVRCHYPDPHVLCHTQNTYKPVLTHHTLNMIHYEEMEDLQRLLLLHHLLKKDLQALTRLQTYNELLHNTVYK